MLLKCVENLQHAGTDVILISEDVHIPCHRDILGAKSEYFSKMFNSMKERTAESVIMVDIDREHFAASWSTCTAELL